MLLHGLLGGELQAYRDQCRHERLFVEAGDGQRHSPMHKQSL